MTTLLTTSCGLVDDQLTDHATAINAHQCQNKVLSLAVEHPLVGCDNGSSKLIDGTWTMASTGQVTAVLEASGHADPRTRFLTQDGRMGVLLNGGPHHFVELPALSAPTDGAAYSWRPGGLDSADHATYTGLYRTGPSQLHAVTAGAGAAISIDDGATWSPDPHWNKRFQALDGTRPLEIEDLVLSEEGRIAFILHPEGRQISAEQLGRLITQGAEDTTDSGPRVATGSLKNTALKVRAIPTGIRFQLVLSPGSAPRGLWLFVTHPARAETTRYQSLDWGRTWIDTGYYDFATLQAVGSRRRVAMVGVNRQGGPVVRIKGDGHFSRFASLGELPGGDGALMIALEDVPDPQHIMLARGPNAVMRDISDAGFDGRLLWYYVPATMIFVVAFALMIRRLRTNLQNRSVSHDQ